MVMPESETADDTEAEAPETENAGDTEKKSDTEKKHQQPNKDAAAPDGQDTGTSQQKEDEANVDTQSAEVMAHPGETYRLQVQQGEVCRTICDKLAQNGIIDDSELFRQYLSQIGYASQISIGTYDIPYGLTMEEVANVLQEGPLEKRQ